MTLLKELSFKFKKNDLDTNGRLLQELDTVHRTALMPVLRGKPLAGQSHFKDPSGIAAYNGFGADGWYYEAGVKGRTWRERHCIDDFTDLVTDSERWVGIANDLSEGGVDSSDTPFGKRLYAQYVGPGAEVYDRKGLMVYVHPNPGAAVLSGRVTTSGEGSPLGLALGNSILLAVQQQGSDADYLFVGYVNTATYPFSVVQGHVTAGVPTVTASAALPAGTTELEIAIEMIAGVTYRGFYSLSPIAQPYTGGTWVAVGAAQALPAGWPASAVPRIHAEFPIGATGLRHSLSDVRVEKGVWTGQQRATWWLETQDTSNPSALVGLTADCPDELMVCWNRDGDTDCELVLIDADDPTDLKLWRRWQDFGEWSNVVFGVDKYFSPGWLDADEGHIVLTRNTKGSLSTSVHGEETGEIWIVSLRWDKVIVLDVNGVGAYVSYYDSSTGRMLREASTWGGRRWNSSESYDPVSYYDIFQVPTTNPFVGTLANGLLEPVVPALTYGVNVRRADDGLVYISYGVQEVPSVIPNAGEYFAGYIQLDEDNTSLDYPRKLFRKDSALYDVWDESDEAWVGVALSYARGLWWLQGGENGPSDEIDGVLCRVDASAGAFGNAMTVPITEDSFWRENDLFMGTGINLNLMDSDPVGDETVFVSSGWYGGSHLTVLWYDSGTPSSSVRKTFGVPVPTEGVSSQMDKILPYEGFPRWIPLDLPSTSDISDVDSLRFTGSAGRGEDSYLNVSDGFWLGYMKFDGVSSKSLLYPYFRGAPIDRGDFVLELSAKYIPPFSSGYKFQAKDYMSVTQSATFYLGVLGAKLLMGEVGVTVRGTTSGGEIIGASLNYSTGAGKQSTAATYTPPLLFSTPGADFKVRIKRTGVVWSFLFYNSEMSSWETVLSVSGLRGPVIPFIRGGLVDNVGLPCAVGFEVDHVVLAPADDALGRHFHRPVLYSSLVPTMGYVSGGSSVREARTTDAAGSFVVGDSWVFPGIMPRP